MEVIRPGRDDPKWSKEFECRSENYMGRPIGCGALLRVTRQDLFTTHVHNDCGPRDEVQFRCKLCGTEVAIDEPFVDLPEKKDWQPPPELL